MIEKFYLTLKLFVSNTFCKNYFIIIFYCNCVFDRFYHKKYKLMNNKVFRTFDNNYVILYH